jgi:single-stranded DNA-binding protein
MERRDLFTVGQYSRYFRKINKIINQEGARIAIIGILDQNKWTTDDGQNRSPFQLIANSVEFIKTDGRGFKSGEEPPAADEEVPF